ncbi:MAG: hypothetical protein K0Q58_1248 [Microbacterium sp.]|nr:hypothetical protein [Microbacterium sp.]
MPLHAVPRLPPGLTARDRLRARLDADVPLVVLHAPAGYGKTVALAQWATSTPRRGLWVRVREGIGEPQSFAQHLADELDDAGLLDDDNPLRTAAESLGAADPWALLIRGLRRLEPGFTLVIDESELLYDETVDGIIGLVADLPGLSVRTATRRANHFTRRTLAVDIGLDLIDTSALALTAQEAARILDEDETGEAVGHVIDNGAAPAFARVVLLAGRQLASRPTTPVADADRALEMAVESLLWPRLRTWDADFVEFLQVVALSEVIDVALATELTGAANAGELLDRAEIEGLGYWTAPTVRTAALFVFSPAFRRIVERAVRRRMARSRLRELDLRIARWHLAADRPFPALRGAVMCQDWDLATDVLREYWFALLRSGAQCRDLFRAISPLALRSFPLISMFLAIIYNAGGAQRLRALEFFALAAYGARNQRATGRPADRALLAVIESAASRLAGRTDASARAAQSGVEVLRGMSNDERDRLGRNEATAYNQLGLSLYYAGRTREAMECFRRSVAVGEERGLLAGLQGLAQLAGTLAVDGDMRSAAEAVADADARRWPDSPTRSSG